MNFNDFCLDSKKIDQQTVELNNSVLIDFYNSTGKKFKIEPEDIVKFITCFYTSYDEFYQSWLSAPKKRKKDDDDDGAGDDENYRITEYNEGGYRAIFKVAADKFKIEAFATNGGSQTKALTMIINKVICYVAGLDYVDVNKQSYFDKGSLEKAHKSLSKNKFYNEEKLPLPLKENQSLKSEFKKWLQSEGLSESSIDKYSEQSMKTAGRCVSEFLGQSFSFYDQVGLSVIEFHADILKGLPEWKEKDKTGRGMYAGGLNQFLKFAEEYFDRVPLPKPFILLAGISGTGKTRFVRKQAEATASGRENYRLVPVRPDWHEPSDLLGYITRISAEGPSYVVTDVLKFIIAAWKEASSGASGDKIELKDKYVPFWLCLDEMNLAPVEQYFADYLSILETREWKSGEYTCEPLLKNDVFEQLDEGGLERLRKDLKLEGDDNNYLWESCLKHGIEIPPNLIVAGTVNMDETTHGFSRKVIDRALTIDFGEFFPNDYQLFLNEDSQPKPKKLSYSTLTQASIEDLASVDADPDGKASIGFLEAVNSVLKGTPFELAYRALNELLISVICFKPSTEQELQAVWDDFMMAKVLPRIEGDRDKLQTAEGEPLLEMLRETLTIKLAIINEAGTRPDLLRDGVEGTGTAVRSTKKLKWMADRLENNGFTAFWP